MPGEHPGAPTLVATIVDATNAPATAGRRPSLRLVDLTAWTRPITTTTPGRGARARFARADRTLELAPWR